MVNGESIYNTRPLSPYQLDELCFTQSKDGKTVFVFYLRNESDPLPDQVILPDGYIGDGKKVSLIGYKGRLQVKSGMRKKIVTIPSSFREKNASAPALVFSIQ